MIDQDLRNLMLGSVATPLRTLLRAWAPNLINVVLWEGINDVLEDIFYELDPL